MQGSAPVVGVQPESTSSESRMATILARNLHRGLGVLLDAAGRGRDGGSADRGEARRALVLLELRSRRDVVTEDIAKGRFVLHTGEAPHGDGRRFEGAEGIAGIPHRGAARIAGRCPGLGTRVADEPIARTHRHEEERQEPGSDRIACPPT